MKNMIISDILKKKTYRNICDHLYWFSIGYYFNLIDYVMTKINVFHVKC